MKPIYSIAEKSELAEKIVRMLELGYSKNAIAKELNMHVDKLNWYKKFYEIELANPFEPIFEIDFPEPKMPSLEEQLLGGKSYPNAMDIVRILNRFEQ